MADKFASLKDMNDLASKMLDVAKQELSRIDDERAACLKQIRNLEMMLGHADEVSAEVVKDTRRKAAEPAAKKRSPRAKAEKKDAPESKAEKKVSAKAVKAPKAAKAVKEVKEAPKAAAKKASQRAPRIKADDLFASVLEILRRADSSLSVVEILNSLHDAGYPKTESFKSRVYSAMRSWSKDGSLSNVDRGLYCLPSGVSAADIPTEE